MEQLYQSAGIYNGVLSKQTKEEAKDLFNSLNTATGEEKAKLRELLSFKIADESTLINNRPLLKDPTVPNGGYYCSIM